MNNWRKWIRTRVIRSRLPLYFACLVLLVIALLIVPLYAMYTSKLKAQIATINGAQLSQIQASLDRILQGIDRSTIKLSEDTHVKRFVFLERNSLFENEEDYQLSLRRLYDVLRNEEKFYENMVTVYLYIPETGQVITGQQAQPLEQFKDRDFVAQLADPGQPTFRWLGRRTADVFNIQGDTAQHEVISFYRTFSNDGEAPESMMVMNVRLELLHKFLREFRSEYPLALLITDANHDVIYAQAKDMTLADPQVARLLAGADDDYLVSEASSRYSHWTYAVAIDKAWILRPVRMIGQITFGVAAAVLLCGLAVSLYFSRRYVRPLEQTLGQWAGKASMAREAVAAELAGELAAPGVDLLHAEVKRLVTSATMYGQVVEQNRPVIKDRMLLDLLRNNRWASSRLIPLGIEPGGGYYQVCVALLDDGQELGEHLLYAALNIGQESLAKLGCLVQAVPISEHSFALICGGGETGVGEALLVTRARLQEELLALQSNLKTFLKMSWTIGAGGAYESDTLVSRSYREAAIAVHHRVYRGKGAIIHFEDLPGSAAVPTEDEWLKYKASIIASVRTGNKEQLGEAVEQLAEWLEQHSSGRINHMNYIFYSILISVEQIIYELNLNRRHVFADGQSIFALVDTCTTLVEIRHVLLATCGKMIDYLANRPFAGKASMISAVAEYIQSSYTEEHLSLESVAQRFHMNPSYLGQLMKRELGKTFLQYVTEARIERAKQLLAQNVRTIQDISGEVGYSNRSTFIRVFKNAVGMTPSEYRNRPPAAHDVESAGRR
ncbi:hypothetical protein PA598K_04079 [Paenibacillus sp. 598K]|uniref:helix-turn-helix domain-containing protein n=1 Tax=Paenibacillus sp. 598K TaxID=1117987 RepID=UPI000FFAFE16|nr:helix-turn-helix domain-containing protein [Paenibacillus sp. 598K]GBF75658.1 hypothetical protein PA598K_04079 [Paenibacillus sp. 598K]